MGDEVLGLVVGRQGVLQNSLVFGRVQCQVGSVPDLDLHVEVVLVVPLLGLFVDSLLVLVVIIVLQLLQPSLLFL